MKVGSGGNVVTHLFHKVQEEIKKTDDLDLFFTGVIKKNDFVKIFTPFVFLI